MAIIHIIPDSNKSVIEAFIEFINKYFDTNNHIFYIYTDNKGLKADVSSHKNVCVFSSLKAKNVIKLANENDKIIIHYLKLSTIQMFITLFYPRIFNNIMWVAWGADLYQWKKAIHGNIFERIKTLTKNYIALTFRKRIKYFVGIFPPDIDYFKNEINSNAQTFYASYVGGIDSTFFQKQIRVLSLEEKLARKECIKIQIGHSSSKILNHLDVLEKLSKFKNENIKLFIPLSYGDKEYGDEVHKEAIKIFGDKAICIRDMMNKDDYMEFLSNIDIVIFNTTRQIGLGNLIPLLYMEKKIYIPKGSVMYDFYKNQGINICNYFDINIGNYNSFVSPIDMSAGKEFIISNELRIENKVDMWNKVFEAPLK